MSISKFNRTRGYWITSRNFTIANRRVLKTDSMRLPMPKVIVHESDDCPGFYGMYWRAQRLTLKQVRRMEEATMSVPCKRCGSMK